MKTLALDPSGSFKEGKGKTGWVVMDNNIIESFGQIRAKDFETRNHFFKAHSDLFDKNKYDHIIIEEFRLYKNKASAQTNSEMETSKLIGYLQMEAFNKKIPCVTQAAVHAKRRYKDEILVHKKYIMKDGNGRYFINGVNVSGHIIDALRHALFFNLRMRKKEKNG